MTTPRIAWEVWREQEMWEDEMLRYLKLRVEKEGGPAEFSRRYQVQLPNLVQMLNGKKAIPESVAQALGYEKRIVFVKPDPWDTYSKG